MSKYEPEIRVKGMINNWKKKRIKDVALLNPKSELPDIFEYVDLESVKGTIMDSHRTESKSNAPSRAQRLAQKGDVFFQTVRPYQKNSYLFDLSDTNYVFSTGYAQLRPKINSYLLLSILQEEKFVSKVINRCTGTSYPAINSSDLSKINVYLPEDSIEQTKIGNFFKQLDENIALHQHALDLLKQSKKGFLQKMFPKKGERVPEIRFTGYNEEWYMCKLGDKKDVRDGTHESPKYQQEGNPLVTSKNLTESGLNMDNISYISDEDFSLINKRSNVDIGDILFGMIGTIGNPVIVNRNDFAIKNVALIKSTGSISNHFLIHLLKTSVFSRYIHNENAGNTQKFLGLGKIRDFLFYAPSLEEQTKIGNFFKELDGKIALQEEKLELLKQMKKAFLQKMFV